MKIRALVPDDINHASTWWRITRPLELLRQRGHDAIKYKTTEIPDGDFEDSIVIVHRLIPANPVQFIQNLKDKGAKIILYSMDDMTIDPFILGQYLTASGGMTSYAIQRILDRIPQQIETIKLCNAVIASTDDLADKVQEITKRHCIVLENALDLDWYMEALDSESETNNNGNRVYVGYASGRRPELDLVPMVRAWKYLDQTFDNVRFVVAGFPHDIIDQHISLEKKIRIPWKTLDEWPRSMQVDIGCCPLSDEIEFNYYKSPIKYFEYSMAGAAVVASSRTYVYQYKIMPGLNGYLAKDENDWKRILKMLVEDKMQRRVVVDSASYQIENFESLQAIIDLWEGALS